MPTLHHKIAEAFLSQLAEFDHLDAERIEQLRTLLTDDKKVKAEGLVKIFSSSESEDIK